MHHHYDTVARAIAFIRQRFLDRPSLEEMAAHVHLSPYHFQRVFTEWAGISPLQFARYLSVEYAKVLLQNRKLTLFDTAIETGLSGTGRLHDLFVGIEAMTPGEYRNGGKALDITYNFSFTPFGEVIVAATKKGICHLAFVDQKINAVAALTMEFPNASLKEGNSEWQKKALDVFSKTRYDIPEVRLHLRGTPFQIKVWQALLKIPTGSLSSYSAIASSVGNAHASRAVGSAVGDNPVAYLIPCHRVIRATGEWGQYRWGADRKSAMIGWEAANTQEVENPR